MKSIISGTDFSKVAINANYYAAALAKKADAQLIIYHEYLYPDPAVDLPSFRKRFDEAFAKDKANADTLCELLKANFGIEVSMVMDSTPVLEKLPALVRQHNAGLVIVGKRGANFLCRSFFGSTALSILKHADFPVLVIPEDLKYKEPGNLLLACQPEKLNPENGLTGLRQIAELFNSKINVVNITADSTLQKLVEADLHSDIAEKLYGYDVKQYDVAASNFVKGIQMAIKELKADVLATIPGKYILWDDFTEKSSTRKAAEFLDIPLLTVPN